MSEIEIKQLKNFLKKSGKTFREFSLDSRHKMLIQEDGCRIFGPYISDSSVPLTWINSKYPKSPSFDDFFNAGNWDMGGDRIWIAPEFPFFTKSREHFKESYTVQPGIDPADSHISSEAPGLIELSSLLQADLYESSWKHKRFHIRRQIRPLSNPLSASCVFSDLVTKVSYCGFQEHIYLEDFTPDAPMPLEIWNLFQVRPGGTFLIPYRGKTLDYVDYYAPSSGNVLSFENGLAKVKVHSHEEHKIGFKAYQTHGRVGYLLKLSENQWTLLIRNYYNNPSDPYIKEPSDTPGQTGCSLFIYMNDTRDDGFAELETTSTTFGYPDSGNGYMDLDFWFFTGTSENIQQIIDLLL